MCHWLQPGFIWGLNIRGREYNWWVFGCPGLAKVLQAISEEDRELCQWGILRLARTIGSRRNNLLGISVAGSSLELVPLRSCSRNKRLDWDSTTTG